MFVILCLAIGDFNGKDLNVNAMAVSLSLFFAIKLSGDFTGGALYPAIGLAQNVFLKIYDEHDHKTWKMLLVHIFGPLLGGIIAAPVFWLLVKGRKIMKADPKVQIIDSTIQNGTHLHTETPIVSKNGTIQDGSNHFELSNK